MYSDRLKDMGLHEVANELLKNCYNNDGCLRDGINPLIIYRLERILYEKKETKETNEVK